MIHAGLMINIRNDLRVYFCENRLELTFRPVTQWLVIGLNLSLKIFLELGLKVCRDFFLSLTTSIIFVVV